jgi:plasmid stability protein
MPHAADLDAFERGFYNGSILEPFPERRMTVTLSIKNVPDALAARLRRRAAAGHRSLQGELLAILEEAVAGERRITVEEARRLVLERGLETPAEARDMVRADRDAR